MINQIVKFTVKPTYKDEFQQALLENQLASSQEPGNVEMRIYVDNKDANLFFAYDRWVDQDALNSHLHQPHTTKLIKLTENALVEPAMVLNLGETTPAPIALKQADEGDDKFNIFFIFKLEEEYREALIAQFEEHIKHTRTEAGCLLFDLFTVDGSDDTLVVYEHWRKESDVWDIHFNQPYAKVTGALMEKAVVGDMNQYMNFVTQITG
ncbi:putative quinol monooxygenase [Vibrio splendidus]|uniref:putative quinol monooxygenase n=1 Tax=Vibrio splendidus TaxID=29497 RepID=UPI00030EE9E7|nr:putative quinol monooxygenase [Vibrio splendidus]OEF84380.1 antibiotic biosynthesis monooxygenase [Vibrio splendidus 1F-157]PMI79257.1 antibiotic biosynthesis monooxygenase [Vibrio splendidus]PMJ83569.1 antibiotic biosynthesis monooxygenase [Vibrio splendidus]PTP59826.1 antibiotic biosynthesis monooxygenase [Vibrio splendidus]